MPLPDKARSRAVLIGTGAYRSAALPDLPPVIGNLTALHAALTDPRHGAFANCDVLVDPADQSEVAHVLADIATEAEDLLLVYYAGHGLVGTRRLELFLGLADTDPARPQYSALPFTWVRDELLDSPAATKVLILDCCFSGLAVEGFLGDRDAVVGGQVSVRGTYTLAATPADMAALAPPGARYTAFTGELLSLLVNGVPGGPGELDLSLIFRHLTARMRESGRPVPRQYGTDNVLDLALARNPAMRATPAPAPQRVRPKVVVRRAAPGGKKPHLAIPVLGHRGHGKTSLAEAIEYVLSGGLPVSQGNRHVCETGSCQFEFADHADVGGVERGLVAGEVASDAVLLAVDVVDGVQRNTREQVELAEQLGVPYVVVALTKSDLAGDPVLVEREVRELLSSYGFPGDEVPVVQVSARGALEGVPRWTAAVQNLVSEIEMCVPEPESLLDRPFLMAIEDVFHITGRGTVVTGRIETGQVRGGTAVDVLGGERAPVRTVVDSVEKYRARPDAGYPGENVGLYLRGVPADGVERGQVVVARDTATTCLGFDARVHLPDVGDNSRLEFRFRTMVVPGSATISGPGDLRTASVRLALPVVMAPGLRFEISRGGGNIGAGTVIRCHQATGSASTP